MSGFNSDAVEGSTPIVSNPSWWDQLFSAGARALNGAIDHLWDDNTRPQSGATPTTDGSATTLAQQNMWIQWGLIIIGVIAVIALVKRR